MVQALNVFCTIVQSEDTLYNYPTADRLAQLVEHQAAVRKVVGSDLGRTNTQGL